MTTSSGAIEHVSFLWAGPDRAAELARLHAEVFARPWNAASLKTVLEHPGAITFVARVGQPLETVGFIVGRVAADEAEILSLGVHRIWQRRGIGRQLVRAFSRAAKKAEASCLYLEVAEGNGAALGLYEQLGFVKVGRRRAYYEDAGGPTQDAINLSLVL